MYVLDPRRAARAAVLLVVAALAACSDAPTSAVITAADHPAAWNTYPAPAPSVSNSNGNPLISWGALAGATGYSVVLVQIRTEIDKATLHSQTTTYTYPVGSTTGTSLLDAARAYTGSSSCTSYGTYKTVMTRYQYRVTASFADGSSFASVGAPVAPC